MAIRTKLILILLGFIILPMMLGVAVLFSRMQGVVRDVRVMQLENIANLEKERVDAFFSERKSDVQLFQTYPVVKDNLPTLLKYSSEKQSSSYANAQRRLEERLKSVQAAYGYSDVMLVDSNGTIVLVASEAHIKDHLGKRLSFIDAGAFEGGRKGVYFSGIYKSGNGFGMLCTAPIYGRAGEFIGEAAFEIDAGRVFELVHETTGLGQTGETFIGIPGGEEVMFINPFHPERNKAIKVKDLFGGKVAKPMQYALHDKNGAGDSIDYLGHDVLAAWRKVPSSGWGLVAKIDSAEAYAPVVRLKKLALVSQFLVLLFCTAAAMLLSRSIVMPIMTLRKGMEKVGSGNLDYKVGTEAKDEIGQLSREFDRMAESLQHVTASRDDLDREVAERKQAEDMLERLAYQNKLILDSAGEGIMGMDALGKHMFVNPAAAKMLGWEVEELIGSQSHSTWHHTRPDGSPYPEEECNIYVSSQQGVAHQESEEVFWKKDGTAFPVEYTSTPVWENDKPVGVVVTFNDITERKRNEEVLRASVRLSEYGLNHSLDELLTMALDEAEAQTDSRIGFFHFVDADGKTLQLQTWSTNTLQNMCSAEGKGQHYPVDKAGVWVEAIAQRCPVVHNDYASLPNRKGLPPGHAPVIRELVVPVLRGGQVMGVLGVGNKPGEYVAQDIDTVSRLANLAWDIILAKRAEDEVRKLNQDLERRVIERTAKLAEINNELEAFSYSVSHDLRAPLRHIQGFVEMLAKNAESSLDEKSRRYLNTISSSATRMGELIDDLLMFSRMGRAEMRMTMVDLGKVAETLIREMRLETEGRDIEWIINTLPTAYCDPSMIRLVMVNLISNALKFTKHRTHAVIEIGSMSGEDGETTFFVRDNGAGFDMQYVDKLFGVFQRLHRIEEFEGTGIGLANVRRIISRHGGRTWAEGALEKGATIYFTLPDKKEAKGEQDERA